MSWLIKKIPYCNVLITRLLLSAARAWSVLVIMYRSDAPPVLGGVTASVFQAKIPYTFMVYVKSSH